MSNQPNEAAIRRYRVIAVSHDQCVNTHGVSAIEDAAGALVYYGDHDAVVTRLRSALANAEKDAAEWKESSRAWQEQASVIHLERDRLECDALRSALGACEKERDEARAELQTLQSAYGAWHERTPREVEIESALKETAPHDRDSADNAIAELLAIIDGLRGVNWAEGERANAALAKLAEAEKALLVIGERAMCDFDDATVGDVDRVVTDHMKYKDWLRSVMTAATERDALAAQLAEARGLFPLPGEPAAAAEILDGVIDFFESLRDPGPCHRDHHGGCQEHGYLGLSPTEKCPMEEIPERLEWLRGHQKWLRDVAAFLAPPSDRGAEGES